jgi:solute carrier family 25 folate transporter 32
LAGAATTVATNPLWLIKTRIQLGQQTTIRGAVRDIVSRQGVRGLYRGLGPGLLLVSHGAVQFMVYDELNRVLGCDDPHERMLTAVASKVAAMGVTFPLQVVKTRLQDARSLGRAEYATLWGAVRAMFRGEGGVAVFYRGWVPAVVRLVPANALTLVSYEWFVRVLQ